MRVVIAPDSFGGTLSSPQAAAAIAEGWRRVRADDLVGAPMSDGGEGLLGALLAGPYATAAVRETEVVDGAGLATTAPWLLTEDGVAVVESAQACGLSALPSDRRDPRRTTTWGVGQLLEAARRAGARRILVGLGGTATVDGGTGALSALGFRLTVTDRSGLKVGGQDLPDVAGAARTWVADWSGVEVALLADVTEVLGQAAATYGPQKGADEEGVAHLARGLDAWRAVAERDLGAAPTLAQAPGSGAAGGLGYGLAAGLGARFVPGARTVAELIGLAGTIAGTVGQEPADLVGQEPADLVVTGEGRLDATSRSGKVVATVGAIADTVGVPVAAVVGRDAGGGTDLADVEESAPGGPGEDPAEEVAAAAARLAARYGHPLG